MSLKIFFKTVESTLCFEGEPFIALGFIYSHLSLGNSRCTIVRSDHQIYSGTSTGSSHLSEEKISHYISHRFRDQSKKTLGLETNVIICASRNITTTLSKIVLWPTDPSSAPQVPLQLLSLQQPKRGGRFYDFHWAIKVSHG